MSFDNSFASSSRNRGSSTAPGRSSPTLVAPSSRIHDSEDSQNNLEIDSLDKDEALLQKLTRYWINERNSPEILAWQGIVVEAVLDRLHAQVRLAQRVRNMISSLTNNDQPSYVFHFRSCLLLSCHSIGTGHIESLMLAHDLHTC
jgi:hypothetical protein